MNDKPDYAMSDRLSWKGDVGVGHMSDFKDKIIDYFLLIKSTRTGVVRTFTLKERVYKGVELMKYVYVSDCSQFTIHLYND